MGEPLTEEDLNDIEKGFYGKPDVQTLILCNGITAVNNEGVKHRRENAKLREFLRVPGRHCDWCDVFVRPGNACNCGLDAALKGKE